MMQRELDSMFCHFGRVFGAGSANLILGKIFKANNIFTKHPIVTKIAETKAYC